MRSLRFHMTVYGVLLIGLCLLLGAVMVALYRVSPGMQMDAGQRSTEQSCRQIAARYAQSAPPAEGPQLDLLRVLLQLVLIEAPDVEGGVWRAGAGMLAYAYPTYEGGGAKTDVPPAEQPLLEQLARRASVSQRPQSDRVRGRRELLIAAACPLPGHPDAAVWTMTRTPVGALWAEGSLRIGLAALALVVGVSGLWLGWLLHRALGHVTRLQQALAGAEDGAMPALAPTGLAELDRIVEGFNAFRVRFEQAQRAMHEAVAQRHRDMRLAALGRMSSAVAHEIRNPIAAMRLKAENALAAPVAAQREALHGIVAQVERLDATVQSLLALVQPLSLARQPVALPAWCAARLAAVQHAAAARGVQLRGPVAPPACARFDPAHMARALDNLLDNAVRHARGDVALSVRHDAAQDLLVFKVQDDGPGVPEALQARLFEPFVTAREQGTGLGLALAREVAIAHGGDLRHVPGATGARFSLELPWHAC